MADLMALCGAGILSVCGLGWLSEGRHMLGFGLIAMSLACLVAEVAYIAWRY